MTKIQMNTMDSCHQHQLSKGYLSIELAALVTLFPSALFPTTFVCTPIIPFCVRMFSAVAVPGGLNLLDPICQFHRRLTYQSAFEAFLPNRNPSYAWPRA